MKYSPVTSITMLAHVQKGLCNQVGYPCILCVPCTKNISNDLPLNL